MGSKVLQMYAHIPDIIKISSDSYMHSEYAFQIPSDNANCANLTHTHATNKNIVWFIHMHSEYAWWARKGKDHHPTGLLITTQQCFSRQCCTRNVKNLQTHMHRNWGLWRSPYFYTTEAPFLRVLATLYGLIFWINVSHRIEQIVFKWNGGILADGLKYEHSIFQSVSKLVKTGF